MTQNPAKDLLVQGGVEASEEMLTEIANTVSNAFVMGAQSDWSKLLRENGGNELEAIKQKTLDVLHAGLSAFITGGVTGGIFGGVSYANNVKQKNYMAERIYGADPGGFVAASLKPDPDNAYAQKLQRYLDEGKTLTGAQLNLLAQQNEKAMTAQDKASIQSAAEARLTELGETGDVTAIAAALTKQAAGEKLSKAEQRIIAESKYGSRVANELNTENIKSGDYASAWAQQLDTNRINAEEYSRLVEAAQLPQETAEATRGKVVPIPRKRRRLSSRGRWKLLRQRILFLTRILF